MFEITRIVLFSCVLIALGIIDCKRRIIPNKIVYPAIIGTIVANILSDEITIISSLVGGVSLAVFFIVASLILKNIGMGDVKLGLLMGLMTGFPEGMVALVSGVFLGGIVAAVLVVSKVRNRKDSMPYGPYLVIGTLFVLIGMQYSLFDFLYAL